MFKKLIGFLVAFIAFVLFVTPTFADTVSVNFENPPYTLGIINGQNGWIALGSAGLGCAVYDQAVNSSLGTTGFGAQSFRISDAVTSGCFSDQAFAKPLVDAVGEVDSTAGSFSAGTLQREFTMEFDIASAVPGAEQPGLHVSVSPDRGDGSRMSYLRFEDSPSGINVFFDDVHQLAPCTPKGCANFVETQIATGLDRTVSHHVKLTLVTLDGPSNDVVKVWIDGKLVKTGTSWEDYYRYDPEASAEQSPRIVRTVLFRSGGDAVPEDTGHGFLFDNLNTNSGSVGEVNLVNADIFQTTSCSSDNVTNTPYKGHVMLITPDGANDLMIQGVIQGLSKSTTYYVWVRNLDSNGGYTGPNIGSYTPLGYYKLVSFTTNKQGDGNFHYQINESSLPDGSYPIQVALNSAPNSTQIGCTEAATTRNFLTVNVH